MTNKEASKIINLIYRIYPRAFPNVYSVKDKEETIEAWANILSGCSFKDAEQAVYAYAKTSQYQPTPYDIITAGSLNLKPYSKGEDENERNPFAGCY